MFWYFAWSRGRGSIRQNRPHTQLFYFFYLIPLKPLFFSQNNANKTFFDSFWNFARKQRQGFFLKFEKKMCKQMASMYWQNNYKNCSSGFLRNFMNICRFHPKILFNVFFLANQCIKLVDICKIDFFSLPPSLVQLGSRLVNQKKIDFFYLVFLAEKWNKYVDLIFKPFSQSFPDNNFFKKKMFKLTSLRELFLIQNKVLTLAICDSGDYLFFSQMAPLLISYVWTGLFKCL